MTTSTTPIAAKNSATNASQEGLGECTGGPTTQEREAFCLALVNEDLFEGLHPKKDRRRRPPPEEKTKASTQRRIGDEDLRLKKRRRPPPKEGSEMKTSARRKVEDLRPKKDRR